MLPRHPQPRARLPSVATSLPAPTTYLPTTHPLGAHAFPAPPTARAAAKRRNLPACPNGLLTYYSPACRPASLDLPDRTTSSPIVLMPALRVHGFAPNIISLPEMVRPRNRDGAFFFVWRYSRPVSVSHVVAGAWYRAVSLASARGLTPACALTSRSGRTYARGTWRGASACRAQAWTGSSVPRRLRARHTRTRAAPHAA